MPARPLYEVRDLLDHRRSFNEAAIRALASASYAGSDTTLGFVLGRYKMLLDARDVGVSSHLMLDGFWEMWVTEALIGAVRGGSTVIDVGAGLGYYSLLMADLTGPHGRLLAFEPNPVLAMHARKSLALNGFATFAELHACAIGADEGVARLDWDRTRPAAGRIEDWAESADPVAVRRLDSFPEAIHAAFVKIDVQGREQQVWRGMTGVLANGQPLTIFMRFDPGHHADPAGFLSEIVGEGFVLEIADPSYGVIPATIDAIVADGITGNRMLCFRR